MGSPAWHRVTTAGPHLHFIATLLWPVLRACQRCRRKPEKKNQKDPSHSLHVNEVARLPLILQARLARTGRTLVSDGHFCPLLLLMMVVLALFSKCTNGKSAANRPRLTIPQRLQQLR